MPFSHVVQGLPEAFFKGRERNRWKRLQGRGDVKVLVGNRPAAKLVLDFHALANRPTNELGDLRETVRPSRDDVDHPVAHVFSAHSDKSADVANEDMIAAGLLPTSTLTSPRP